MGDLDVDLWPTGLVLMLAAVAIAIMRALERHSDRRAAARTQKALQLALGDPTEE
jgi:hypothetical protein